MRLFRIFALALALAGLIMALGCASVEASAPILISNTESAVPADPTIIEDPEPILPPIPTPTPVAPPQTLAPEPAPADPIKALIAGMSPRELIGQLVMIGFSGMADMSAESKELMREYCAGNIILFGQNVRNLAQTKKLIAAVNAQNANPNIPLSVCIDIEGGSVTRFRGQWKPFISGAATLGKANDPERVHRQYTQIGAALKDMGFNLDLAPVADIAQRPSATFMGNRMFGSDPEKVSLLIREAVKGLHDGGIAAAVKHFPGHGETATDSHSELPVIGTSMEQLESYALVPFKAAIDAEVDLVLIAHLLLPNIDDEITSVSYTVITELLRERMGFSGVVISDDMRMAGLTRTYSPGEAAVRFIAAGGDIALIGKQLHKQREVFDSLYAAHLSGALTRERLEESVERVLRMKQAWCGFTP